MLACKQASNQASNQPTKQASKQPTNWPTNQRMDRAYNRDAWAHLKRVQTTTIHLLRLFFPVGWKMPLPWCWITRLSFLGTSHCSLAWPLGPSLRVPAACLPSSYTRFRQHDTSLNWKWPKCLVHQLTLSRFNFSVHKRWWPFSPYLHERATSVSLYCLNGFR